MNEGQEKIYNELISKYNLYAEPEFDHLQMRFIKEGFEKSLDVSIYARPEFDFA